MIFCGIIKYASVTSGKNSRNENELKRFKIVKNNLGVPSTGYLFPEGHKFAEKVLQAALLNNAKYNPIFIYGKSGSNRKI